MDAQTPNVEPIIAVAGTAAVDMTLRDPPAGWIGSTSRDHFTTETVRLLAAPPEMGLGGNGAAAAYVMGRLGAHVRLNSPTGDDAAGALIERWLDEAGVEQVAKKGPSTNMGITAVDADAMRLGTLQHPGPTVDWRLSAADAQATWLLVACNAKARADELDQVHQAFRGFTGRGKTRLFDSGIAWIKHATAAQMHSVWADVDLLIGTVEELGHWCSSTSPRQIAQTVLNKGPRGVVIKMAADGAAWQTQNEPFTHRPAEPVDRADLTIGAGDAFNGGLIASLAFGRSMLQAVDMGQKIAAEVVKGGRGAVHVDWERLKQQFTRMVK